MSSSRSIKKELLTLFGQADLAQSIQTIDRYPFKTVITPLLSFLYHCQETIKWHAVTAIGYVIPQLAIQDLEFARGIMRRLMWSMNDESGGIGWGAPEAMGEIMACCEKLAKEYSFALISYIDPKANYIDNNDLQNGILWGIGRLAQARPALISPHSMLLVPFLSSANAVKRGLSAWAIQNAGKTIPRSLLEILNADQESVIIYTENTLKHFMINELIRDC